MWRRPVCQTLSKALNISSTTAWVALDLLKALVVILSDTIVRRSAVDWEDLKLYWKSEKRSHFSRWSTIPLFRSFSKTLLTTETRLTRRQFLALTFPQHSYNLQFFTNLQFSPNILQSTISFNFIATRNRLSLQYYKQNYFIKLQTNVLKQKQKWIERIMKK